MNELEAASVSALRGSDHARPRGADVLAPGWRTPLRPVFEAEPMQRLRAFLRDEYRNGATVYPPREHMFRALQLLNPEDVRVIILGQDPYHGPGQANGLAFAVSAGQRVPPSLVNIFKEMADDLSVSRSCDPSLLGWAEQGVLLLNSVLTVRAGEAFSHRGRGWEEFTASVIRVVNEASPAAVFVLWGSSAQKAAACVDRNRHLVLASPHPSPLSAHRGFFGSRPFSRANRFLSERGRGLIDWARTGAEHGKVLDCSGSGWPPPPA